MTTEGLEESFSLYKLLDSELFKEISTEVFLHTMLLFITGEELHDTFIEMVNDHENKYYFGEVRDKLKALYDRLLEEEIKL